MKQRRSTHDPSWHPAWLCAVVCVVVSYLSAFKKQKLFHGEQCKEAKKFFNEVLLEELHGLSVKSFEETINSKAYLCHLCDGYAANYRKYQKNLNDSQQYCADINAYRASSVLKTTHLFESAFNTNRRPR